MLLGHYAVAFAAKRVSPRLNLGTAIAAAQLLDELWPVFMLLGLEHVRVVPGLMAASPFDFVSYPYTHSLLAAVLWGILAGGIYFGVRRDGRSAALVGGLVVSHWVLDLPMHRPDLPLWPGSTILVGFGLWRSVPITLAIEFGLLALGLRSYLSTTRPLDRIGTGALVGFVLALMGTLSSEFLSAPPTSERAIALLTLSLWIFIPLGWWIDRHRKVVGLASPS